jgi:hypothetical protein
MLVWDSEAVEEGPWHEYGYVEGLLADRHGPSQGEARFSKAALQEKQDTLT